MYHKMVSKDLGVHNTVATYLRKAARQTKISDIKYPNVSEDQLLDK
jgi:hypothetical protein